MTSSTLTKPRTAVDGDFEVELLRTRAKQLQGYIAVAEAELAEIKEKFLVKLEESGVDAYTIGGLPVVQVSRFDRTSVPAEMVQRYAPSVFRRFAKITPVVRVLIR